MACLPESPTSDGFPLYDDEFVIVEHGDGYERRPTFRVNRQHGNWNGFGNIRGLRNPIWAGVNNRSHSCSFRPATSAF